MEILCNIINVTFDKFNVALLIKVPILWVMKGSYFGFGSPQQQVDMHSSSKNTFIFL